MIRDVGLEEMKRRSIHLLVVLAFAGCAAPLARDTAEAERYIQTIGGVTSIVERLAQSYSVPFWGGHYDAQSGMVTHDRDGQPKEEWKQHRALVRALLVEEIDQSFVRTAMLNSLTNTFTVSELKGVNDLSDAERALLWQCASKKHFMQKPRTPEEREMGFRPVQFTQAEQKALDSFSPAVRSALDKLLVHGQRFNASVGPEFQRALSVAKKQAEEEAQPEN